MTLSALRPQSATPLTATLTDPDGHRLHQVEITTGVIWQWAKASSKSGSYRDIEESQCICLHAG